MIDPSHGLNQQVKAGRLCGKCGYELTGLQVGHVCPECSTLIPPNKLRTTKHDTLTAVGSDYLHRLRLHAILLAISACGMTLGVFLLGPVPIVAVFAGAIWVYAVHCITRPKPLRAGLTQSPSQEMRLVRTVARTTQFGWPIGAVLAVLALHTPGAISTALNIGSALASLAAVVGIVPLSLWLAELCDWGRDESLGRRFRTSAWLISLLCVVFLVVLAQILSSLLGSFLGLLNIIAIWAAFAAVIGLGLFVVCLLQLAVLIQNALANAIEAEGRVERIAARKLQDEARSGNAPPGEIRRQAPRPIPCTECGYDLTGLPGDNPCPECGAKRGESLLAGPHDKFRIRQPPVLDITPIPIEGLDDQPDEPSDDPTRQSGRSTAKRNSVERTEDVKPYDLAD